MQAMCGTICSDCSYKDKVNCPGCSEAQGKMFWGQCRVATCCMEKSLEHCSLCAEFPCAVLNEFSYDKEHGDNGRRIENLRKRIAEGR